ncbi:hypothetical protein K3X44_10105 [Aliiroseovarius crassostreae]|uniref:hypothetical protein n=1 Tax=Aliiroseovarius crassostreae TaxID=154981 RepID=UPI0021FC30AA|nr:hypothetical protein [Aliiroseovarius crassostreae]UWQ00864.1 hypothetical protein K3X44_10105 [Aliiroseovarius crassostreae]
MKRPRFEDLPEEIQRQFGNGVGPYWLPDWVRAQITGAASWFFDEASWRHHDFGYAVGGDRWDRARCDWKFYRAMLRDACRVGLMKRPVRMLLALILATVFYLAVRIGGQFGSFKYRDHYASVEDVIRQLGVTANGR